MEYSTRSEEGERRPAIGVAYPRSDEYSPSSPGAKVDTQAAVRWSTGLFDCREDPAICWTTCLCPCVTFGRIAEIVDKGNTFTCVLSGCWYVWVQHLTCLACLCTKFYRTKMRKQYNLEEAPHGDFRVHFCDHQCALCQEYRELEHRGFDMTIGYKANMERQRQRQAETSPPQKQVEMMR